MNSKLFDLVEGRWNTSLKAFVKIATYKTNVPYAICMDEKIKRQGVETINHPRPIRFKIVPNGELQYSNTFILTKKKDGLYSK